MPEARITLAQAVTYLATAPKSNAAYNAINVALMDIEKEDIGAVPMHLRDSHYGGAKELNHGVEYKYPHNYDHHYVKQQYLPKELNRKKYYEPTGLGYEKRIKDRMDFLSKL